jgi:SHS2 domain-containing protein
VSLLASGYNRGTVPGPFEILEHPADVGFVAYGRTLEELFENAALAMLSLACELDSVEEKVSRFVQTTGGDNEALLYAWLAEILAVADADQLVFRRADVTAVGGGRVCGTLYGEPYDKKRHAAGTYIKAVTYHQLKVEQTKDGWRAQVYLDV